MPGDVGSVIRMWRDRPPLLRLTPGEALELTLGLIALANFADVEGKRVRC
jgi:hypothetical protein